MKWYSAGNLHPELLGRRLANGWLLLLREVCVTGQPRLGPDRRDDAGVDKHWALVEGVGGERRGEGKATLVSWKDTVSLMEMIPWPLAFSLFCSKPGHWPQDPGKLFVSHYQGSCPTWRRHCVAQDQHYHLEEAKQFKDEHMALCTFGVIYGHSLLFL